MGITSLEGNCVKYQSKVEYFKGSIVSLIFVLTKSSISGRNVPLAICPVTESRNTVLLSAKLILKQK
jgi:hypothetical protein